MNNSYKRHVRRAEHARLQSWGISESSQDVLFIKTHDQWELALSRYAGQVTQPYPVLLCHGLGSNRLTFDISPNASLAGYLAECGYEVYALDLRGHGLSQKPALRGAHRWGWGFNDYCELDIPAAIDAVLARSGCDQLHFIGHSMGGILLYGRAALGDGRIRSGVTLGSSLDYSDSPSIFHFLTAFAFLCKPLPSVPIHWPSLVSSWMTQYTRKAIDSVIVNPPNVDVLDYRKLSSNSLHAVSTRVLMDMVGAFNGKGLLNRAGQPYAQLLEQAGYGFPILSLAGVADRQCSPLAVARFGTENKVFGKQHGCREDYGHVDLIMGVNARTEVWPFVSQWLDRHR